MSTIAYDDGAKEITVDRAGLKRRFNTEQGEQRTRPLPKGLFHLRIFIDRSSIEIFVNDGDAVFSSRIFPTEGEEKPDCRGRRFHSSVGAEPCGRGMFRR